MDRLTPATVKPGSVLTIDGEYLNLIKEVIFADNVIVVQEDFVSQDRKQIKLTVPEEAQNGKSSSQMVLRFQTGSIRRTS